MNNLVEIQRRFLREGPKMRLGHLASDLSRVASFIEMGTDGKAVKAVMEEGKFFAEWTAEKVDLEIQILLAEIQCFLAQKESEWDVSFKMDSWRQDVIRQVRNWSQELLQRAGFIEHDERS